MFESEESFFTDSKGGCCFHDAARNTRANTDSTINVLRRRTVSGTSHFASRGRQSPSIPPVITLLPNFLVAMKSELASVQRSFCRTPNDSLGQNTVERECGAKCQKALRANRTAAAIANCTPHHRHDPRVTLHNSVGRRNGRGSSYNS